MCRITWIGSVIKGNCFRWSVNGESDMNDSRSVRETRTVATELVESLMHRGQQAGIHLARLILLDESEEGGAYRLFACALVQQLQHWPHGMEAIGEDDVVSMLRSAARELIAESWEE
jgi:hypothetical protein